MGHDEPRDCVARYWRALEKGDLEAAAAEFGDHFVEEWPQSGERIRGARNWLALVRSHPEFPAIRERRTLGGGEVWVTEATFDYARDGSAPYHVCAVQECRDGRIVKITQFFAPPFAPAGWRSAWVERMA